MKYLALFAVLAAFVFCSNGLNIPNSWSRETFHTEGDDDLCHGKVFSCADCYTSRVCHPNATGSVELYKDTPCPSDRKYCESTSGTCTSVEPANCGKQDDFVCLQKEHYFPDNDCHKFHYCDQSYASKLFECNPNTFVFNPVSQMCEEPSKTKCGKFNCQDQAVKKVKHDVFPSYFGMCKQENATFATPVVVDVCPDYYILNTTSQQCEPDCKSFHYINIPDISDCHYYFHCKEAYITSAVMVMVKERHQCPKGLAYDPSAYECVDQGTVDSCKKSL